MNKTGTEVTAPLELLQTSRARLQRWSRLLDHAVQIPGTRWRVGADAIIGLVPVAGDALGLALSAAILYEGLRIGAPRALLGRMLAIAVLDAVLGLVPLLGDALDVVFQSNRLNARLLLRHLEREELALSGGAASRSRPGRGWLLLLLAAGLAALAYVAARSLR